MTRCSSCRPSGSMSAPAGVEEASVCSGSVVWSGSRAPGAVCFVFGRGGKWCSKPDPACADVHAVLSASRQGVSRSLASAGVHERWSRCGNAVHSVVERVLVVRVCPDVVLASQLEGQGGFGLFGTSVYR